MPAAPVFDLYSTEIDADPYPAYARLRDEFPCYWSEQNGIWILTRYADVYGAGQDWRTFSSAEGNMIDEIPGRAGVTLGTTDPPRHDRLRKLSQVAFTKRSLEYLVGPVQELASHALRELLERGRFDFVQDYSSRITVGILFRMMGLPLMDAGEIRRKVILAVSTDKALRGRNPSQLGAFAELGDIITSEAQARRAAPREDLLTMLAMAEVDGERLSEREVALIAATFVMAGVESLSSFMTLLALNLHDQHDARRTVVADPTLMENAIEESLRFNTSAQRFKRTLTRDLELHGQHLRRGDKVALAYGAANRDPRKFEAPDEYRLARRPTTHLGFGAGPHFCLGSQMARLVAATAMREFLRLIPEFRLTATKLDWLPSSNFRSPMKLPFEIVRVGA